MSYIGSSISYLSRATDWTLEKFKVKSTPSLTTKQCAYVTEGSDKRERQKAAQEIQNASASRLGNRRVDISSRMLNKLPPINFTTSIVSLDASNNKLESIEHELANLHTLGELNISFNNISELGGAGLNLSHLHTLTVNRNPLTTITFDPKYLANLRTLDLASCGIKEFPGQIFDLTKLEHLDISRNKISLITDDLDKLPLKSLNLSNNPVDLYKNEIDNRVKETPDPVKLPLSLKILKLAGTEIVDLPGYPGLNASVVRLPKLAELDISSNALIKEIPEGFGLLDPADKNFNYIAANSREVKLKIKIDGTDILNNSEIRGRFLANDSLPAVTSSPSGPASFARRSHAPEKTAAPEQQTAQPSTPINSASSSTGPNEPTAANTPQNPGPIDLEKNKDNLSVTALYEVGMGCHRVLYGKHLALYGKKQSPDFPPISFEEALALGKQQLENKAKESKTTPMEELDRIKTLLTDSITPAQMNSVKNGQFLNIIVNKKVFYAQQDICSIDNFDAEKSPLPNPVPTRPFIPQPPVVPAPVLGTQAPQNLSQGNAPSINPAVSTSPHQINGPLPTNGYAAPQWQTPNSPAFGMHPAAPYTAAPAQVIYSQPIRQPLVIKPTKFQQSMFGHLEETRWGKQLEKNLAIDTFSKIPPILPPEEILTEVRTIHAAVNRYRIENGLSQLSAELLINQNIDRLKHGIFRQAQIHSFTYGLYTDPLGKPRVPPGRDGIHPNILSVAYQVKLAIDLDLPGEAYVAAVKIKQQQEQQQQQDPYQFKQQSDSCLLDAIIPPIYQNKELDFLHSKLFIESKKETYLADVEEFFGREKTLVTEDKRLLNELAENYRKMGNTTGLSEQISRYVGI